MFPQDIKAHKSHSERNLHYLEANLWKLPVELFFNVRPKEVETLKMDTIAMILLLWFSPVGDQLWCLKKHIGHSQEEICEFCRSKLHHATNNVLQKT